MVRKIEPNEGSSRTQLHITHGRLLEHSSTHLLASLTERPERFARCDMRANKEGHWSKQDFHEKEIFNPCCVRRDPQWQRHFTKPKCDNVNVAKLRRTHLQLWQGSSRLSRCPQGRPRGRQQQELRHQIRAAVSCTAPRSSSGTGTPHCCRSQVSQVREHQHQNPVLISHRAALTSCYKDALRCRCTPGARGFAQSNLRKCTENN